MTETKKNAYLIKELGEEGFNLHGILLVSGELPVKQVKNWLYDWAHDWCLINDPIVDEWQKPYSYRECGSFPSFVLEHLDDMNIEYEFIDYSDIYGVEVCTEW